MFKEEGWQVDVACAGSEKVPYCDNQFETSWKRSPFSLKTFKGIKELKNIIKNGKYDVVYCHTPIGGLTARLASMKARKNGTKVVYFAHGFHFYKGAPLKNWLIYYPVEKICSYLTDVLITINKEDYALAQKKMKAKKVVYIPGVGMNLEKINAVNVNFAEKRKELDIPQDATVLLSVGELNKNKNHETVLRAIADMDVYYVIVGKGRLDKHLKNLADELGMSERVKLVGFREDVAELYKISDVFVFPSYREGLSVSVMEAMASGLPCVVSKIRGNTELIDHDLGGYLCSPSDINEFKNAISKIVGDKYLKAKMCNYNIEKVKHFDVVWVNKELKIILY